MARRKNKGLFNYFLLISGLATCVSGIVIQLGYHIGHPGIITQATQKTWGLFYSEWQSTHQIASSIFLMLCIYHIWIHRNWYKGVLVKRLFRRNAELLFLSVIFLVSAISGLIPWIIAVFKKQSLRLLIIEIHDKIAILLVVFIILHIVKRKKRLA